MYTGQTHTRTQFFPVRTPFKIARGVNWVTGNSGHFKLLATLHLCSLVYVAMPCLCECRNIKHCNLCMAFNLLWLFHIFGWLAMIFFSCSLKLLKLACDVSKTHYGLVFMLSCVLLLFYGVAQGHYLRWTFHHTATQTHTITAKCITMCDHLLTSSWNVNRQVCVFA